MPAAKRELVSLDPSSLVPRGSNPRVHSDAEIKKLSEYIKEVGFVAPVVIDEDDGILAGHKRVLAAADAGIASVPCIRVSGLSESEKRSYVIADNKFTLNSSWDEELLTKEIEELFDSGFDTGIIGFDIAELNRMFMDPKEKESPGVKEFDPGEFENFEHKCPKCGFEWGEKESE